MKDNINKVRAASRILDAICKELGDDSPIFREHFDQYSNPVSVVISEYEKLDYRQQDIIGMRLGFDFTKNYKEQEKKSYEMCATAYEMTLAASASKIYHKSLRELASFLM